jgi:hypothetical protein
MSYSPNEDYKVVMHLNRWERTHVAFSVTERLNILLRGRISMKDMIGYGSIGWVPVFERSMDAEAYERAQSPGAQVLSVKRQLTE